MYHDNYDDTYIDIVASLVTIAANIFVSGLVHLGYNLSGSSRSL